MKKITFLLMLFGLNFISCTKTKPVTDEEPVDEPVRKKKKSKKEEVDKVEVTIDTLVIDSIELAKVPVAVTPQSVQTTNPNLPVPEVIKSTHTSTYERKYNGYKSKYPQLIQTILHEKRVIIMEKNNKPDIYYGDWFFDLFDIETAPVILIQYYEKEIDSFISKLSNKGDLQYENLSVDRGEAIK